MALYDKWRYCSHCDYAIGHVVIEQCECPNLCVCPGCGMKKLTDFYYYGSFKHKKRWNAYVNGDISGNPVPYPEEE